MEVKQLGSITKCGVVRFLLLAACLEISPLRLLAQAQVTPSLYYYAVENLDVGGLVVRGTTTAAGIPQNGLILAPSTDYREWLFETSTGLIGYTDFTTPQAGQS